MRSLFVSYFRNIISHLDVKLSLRPELAPEVLGDVGRGPGQRPGHVHHVHDHGLDSVALPLHL